MLDSEYRCFHKYSENILMQNCYHCTFSEHWFVTLHITIWEPWVATVQCNKMVVGYTNCSIPNKSVSFLTTGIGYATQVIVALLNIYYIIVLAWGIFYLSFSFSWDLPWSSCNNTWNTGVLVSNRFIIPYLTLSNVPLYATVQIQVMQNIFNDCDFHRFLLIANYIV